VTFRKLTCMTPTIQISREPQEKEYLKLLGLNIRKWREKKGYTQEEFAPIVGMTRSYITEIETGKRNVSFLNFIKIIEALDVDDLSVKKMLQEIRSQSGEQ
jgi:transcriptional regulator with XRE-family HTH domain